MRLEVRCVKARDFRTPEDFKIQLEPFIDQIGDIAVLTEETKQTSEQGTETEKLSAAIAANPSASIRRIAEITNIGRNRVPGLAEKVGWLYDEKTKWTRSTLFGPENQVGIA